MQLKDTSGPWRLDKDAIIFTDTMFELPSSFSSLGWGGCTGENGTAIFRSYSRPNPFREVRSVRIRVRIFNIWYCIRIGIVKSHIYDIGIQSYPIRYEHDWHYPYSNPNPDKNMKTNVISVISVRIRSIFIPLGGGHPRNKPKKIKFRIFPSPIPG
jgi:hypothetical protein